MPNQPQPVGSALLLSAKGSCASFGVVRAWVSHLEASGVVDKQNIISSMYFDFKENADLGGIFVKSCFYNLFF